MFGRIRAAVERAYAHHWQLGPPTEMSCCSAAVATSVQWNHVGISTEWRSDAGHRYARLCVGPFEVSVVADPTTYQLRREQLGETDPEPRIATKRLGGRLVHGWVSRNHLGLSVNAARLKSGLHVRGMAGPLGFAVEPADGTSTQTT